MRNGCDFEENSLTKLTIEQGKLDYFFSDND